MKEEDQGKVFQLSISHCFPMGTVGDLTLLSTEFKEKDFEKMMKLVRYILKAFPMSTKVEIDSTIFTRE